MVEQFDTSDPEALRRGLRQARLALGKKQAVVIPTDTHYALAVDALSAASVDTLAELKGWDETPILQVLLPSPAALPALAGEVHPVVTTLTETLWPGPLTIILPSSSTLQVNLGSWHQAVAVRMTGHPVTAELLEETGPLAVSAAHTENSPNESLEQLSEQAGERLGVALMDPAVSWEFSSPGSTVLDARGLGDDPVTLAVLREGPISTERLAQLAGDTVLWAEG